MAASPTDLPRGPTFASESASKTQAMGNFTRRELLKLGAATAVAQLSSLGLSGSSSLLSGGLLRAVKTCPAPAKASIKKMFPAASGDTPSTTAPEPIDARRSTVVGISVQLMYDATKVPPSKLQCKMNAADAFVEEIATQGNKTVRRVEQ